MTSALDRPDSLARRNGFAALQSTHAGKRHTARKHRTRRRYATYEVVPARQGRMTLSAPLQNNVYEPLGRRTSTLMRLRVDVNSFTASNSKVRRFPKTDTVTCDCVRSRNAKRRCLAAITRAASSGDAACEHTTW